MKTNIKWYGIFFLLFLIIVITITTPIQRKNTEGFLSDLFSGDVAVGSVSVAGVSIPWIDPCGPVCKAKKAAEKERKRLAKLAEIAKKKRNCIKDGGAWDGSKCHKYKAFPKNVFKSKYAKPKPPKLSFCEKYEKEPTLLQRECLKKNKKSCNYKCCKWCKSKNKCVPYIVNTTEINTIDYLECN